MTINYLKNNMKKFKEHRKIVSEHVNKILQNKRGIIAALNEKDEMVCFQNNVTSGEIMAFVYKILEQDELLEVFLLYLASEKLKKIK